MFNIKGNQDIVLRKFTTGPLWTNDRAYKFQIYRRNGSYETKNIALRLVHQRN